MKAKHDAKPDVIPRIFTGDPQGLVAFITQVFNASGDYHHSRPSEIRIGNSVVMVSGNDVRGDQSACLYVYVEEVDAVFKRAVDAGANVVEAPAVMHYGDRRCMVEDQWGNLWQIASRG